MKNNHYFSCFFAYYLPLSIGVILRIQYVSNKENKQARLHKSANILAHLHKEIEANFVLPHAQATKQGPSPRNTKAVDSVTNTRAPSKTSYIHHQEET